MNFEKKKGISGILKKGILGIFMNFLEFLGISGILKNFRNS
jgi:hypothetical protein